MPPYWPWWAGGASLAVVTVGCCIVARRPLGVSGILARLVNVREELRAERARAAGEAMDPAALEELLAAATAEAFASGAALPLASGGGAPPLVAAGPAASCATGSAGAPAPGSCRGDCASPSARPTLAAHVLFLFALVAGGFLARTAHGGWTPAPDLGPIFERVVGTGARGAIALLVGGLLVGIGTSVSGGCSTGHGLSNCSRLQPAGVAATASFMASAVLTSLFLAGRLP
jgi:hypothetical protein